MYVKAKIRIHSEAGEFDGIALVDTGATGIIADEAFLGELGLRSFGRAEVATLGRKVECRFTDVKNVAIEDAEIGPRRIVVCRFPNEVKERLKSLDCSEKIILGVSALEDAGYIPNTVKGALDKVGFLALGTSPTF